MNNLSIKNGLTSQQLMIVGGEFDKKKKSKGVAWLLWLLLGWVGGHRFYLGHTGLGVAMLLLNWLTFGVWALIDAFFINSNLEKKNEEIEGEILSRFIVSKG
jgi:TM2 domain-containing membrane protein YozV